ncbi:MAG: M23 family metallopeptidase [Tissierellaceae bacterium]|nr:M23 family metallopeptidase [Tissierellaceae bacterium]
MKNRINNTLNILMRNSSHILRKFARKGIIAVSILLFVLLIKALNIRPTNSLLDTIKSSIYYEFSIVEDSKRIFNKGKDLLDDSGQILEVFNLGESNEYEYPSPIQGTLYKKFDKDSNKGIDIKSYGDHEAKAILEGIVKEVVLTQNKGYFVTVQSEEFEHTYGYLSKSYVAIGDIIESQELIGYLGTNKDGEKYLRLEITQNGEYKNPTNYIDIK